MKICNNCGAKQNDTMIFCSQCKEKLREPISEEEKELIEKQTEKKLEKLHNKLGFQLLPAKIFSVIKKIFFVIKRTIKPVIIGLIILTILFITYSTIWRVRVSSSGQDYVERYRDYYYMAVYKPNTMPAPFGNSSKIIYIKIGQKEKMLKKIKEDVINYLAKLIEEYSDIYYKYEISDDFKQVRIYKIKKNIDATKNYDSKLESISLSDLIGLYHNIKEGHSVDIHPAVKFIEPSG